MNITNEKTDFFDVSKVETELVQLQQTEYYLIGTFLRTKGLNLFYFNHLENIIVPAKINFKNTAELFVSDKNKLEYKDQVYQSCTVDNRFIYFEALNMKSALKRLQNYKSGKIKNLCNLRKPEKYNLF